MPEKTLQSPLDSKEIKLVNLKGDQPWILIGRTDAPVFWSPDANSWLIGKVPDAGKDWGQKEKRASEDEMAGQHHQCNGHELRQTPGGGEGRGGMACCSLCVTKGWTWLGDWTTTMLCDLILTRRMMTARNHWRKILSQKTILIYFFQISLLLLLLSRFSCVQLCATP